MNFEFVKIPYGEKIRCVYMMLFESGKFYVGATQNLKHRMVNWKNSILYGDTVSPLVNIEIRSCSRVSFSILELVPDDVDIFTVETFYLQKHMNDPKSLNMSKCSRSFRVPMTKTEIIQKSISDGRTHRIAKYDSDWNLIAVYETLSEAADFSKNKIKSIKPVLNGKKKMYNRHYYRRLDLQMNPIHPVMRKKPPSKLKGTVRPDWVKAKLAETTKRRREAGVINEDKRLSVEKLDMYGKSICTYISLSAAAASIGSDSSNISKVLKGRRLSVKGFKFRYLSENINS